MGQEEVCERGSQACALLIIDPPRHTKARLHLPARPFTVLSIAQGSARSGGGGALTVSGISNECRSASKRSARDWNFRHSCG